MELVSWQKVSGTGRDSSPSQASWSNLKKKKSISSHALLNFITNQNLTCLGVWDEVLSTKYVTLDRVSFFQFRINTPTENKSKGMPHPDGFALWYLHILKTLNVLLNFFVHWHQVMTAGFLSFSVCPLLSKQLLVWKAAVSPQLYQQHKKNCVILGTHECQQVVLQSNVL